VLRTDGAQAPLMRAYFADMSKSPRVVFIMQRIAEDDWQIVAERCVSSHGTIHASCKLRRGIASPGFLQNLVDERPAELSCRGVKGQRCRRQSWSVLEIARDAVRIEVGLDPQRFDGSRYATLWRSPLMNIGTRRHAVSLVGVLRLKLLVR
jgi:hypothetical protein